MIDDTISTPVTVIGAGLAGSEAALQLSRRGFSVRLYEQKPKERTPAQTSDSLCELVCSNSFRGAALTNAVGLLKAEMRGLGSFVMAAAEECRVPAGGALAVDRERFSALMTQWLRADPKIELLSERVDALPKSGPTIVATGPLTGTALAEDIARCLGEEHLAYYDAIAPIVAADSLNREVVFAASRYDKGETEEEQKAYLNCPLTKEQYGALVTELRNSRTIEAKPFEKVRYFEGCLPIEVMAERGEKTLSFGPLKPVGLTDPRTGRWPHAVVQLRKEDKSGQAYNLVGFQTRMARGEQDRVFRMIPGLENAEFMRYGAIHRNTFVNAPKCLDETFRLRTQPDLYFAGQVTGTEGYVESAAGGLLVSHFLAERLSGREPELPPESSAHRGLIQHSRNNPEDYQPSNITFAHLAPWEGPRLKKRAKYEAMAHRSLRELKAWAETSALGWRGDLPESAPDAIEATAASSN